MATTAPVQKESLTLDQKFPLIQSLTQLIERLPMSKNSWYTWEISVSNVWHYDTKEFTKDLPRSLTLNELKTLPRIARDLFTKSQEDGLWLFDDSFKDISVSFQTWSPHKTIQTWSNNSPINNTYNVRRCKQGVFFETGNGAGFTFKKDQSEGSLSVSLQRLTVKKVGCIIRDSLIRLWTSVPHKKGMHMTTIAKKLFDSLPEDQKPSKDQQDKFIKYILERLDVYKTIKKERAAAAPTERRKAIQEQSVKNVTKCQNYITHCEQSERHLAHSEQMELERLQRHQERLQMRYERECAKIQRRKEKISLSKTKLELDLEQKKHARSAVLLSGVCKSLNQHYKTVKNSDLAKNPFTNLSEETFFITEHLLKAPKIA